MEDTSKTVRRLYSRLVRDHAFFESIVPAEYRTLYELLQAGRPSVRLASGERHYMDRVELEHLARQLPWYVHRLVTLPWVFTYRREYWGGRFYLRNPDPWPARAISYLLTGNLASEKRELTVEDMRRLLRSFKTLIIVTIEAKLGLGAQAASHDYEEG